MERIAVGKILQGLRKAKGITQEQLSEVLGVSTAAISKWENEQMYPDISYFPILARFFNVYLNEKLNSGFGPNARVNSI